MAPDQDNQEQKIAYARASLWLPFYAVGMVARIQGDVSTALLENALRKLAILHPPLASRVRVDQRGHAWLTTEGVGAFPLEVRPKVTADDWTRLVLEQERIPFPFDRGPVTRFTLLRGLESSDLVLVAPHVVCDGYSITQVMADLVALLNDSGREVTRPTPVPPVSWQTMPHTVTDDLLLRGLVRLANWGWWGRRRALQQEEYLQMHQCYWARQQNGLQALTLSAAQTADMIARCKQQGVSVTAALMAAFLLARIEFLPDRRADPREISVPVNLRDRMNPSPGRAVGVYASTVDIRLRAKPGMPFWALARESHARLRHGLGRRGHILRTLVLEELDPLIADEVTRAISTDEWSREVALIAPFIKVRGEVRSLVVTNIGRVELPDVGGPYRLETLLPFPPQGPGGSLTLNVLTVGGQMNLILKHRQASLDDALAVQLRDRALSYMFGSE